MRNDIPLAMIVGFLIGCVVATFTVRTYYTNVLYKTDIQHRKQIATQNLKTKLVFVEKDECEKLVNVLEHKGYIEPRPIITE